MEKNYDKILFLVAVLVACASAYCYFSGVKKLEGADAEHKAALALQPGGEPWVEKKIPNKTEQIVETLVKSEIAKPEAGQKMLDLAHEKYGDKLTSIKQWIEDCRASGIISEQQSREISDMIFPSWKEVKPQDEEGLWLFQLFTSPKIWVDNDGKFIVEPPLKKEQIKKYFGYKYGSLKNEKYPIISKGGYIVSADGKIVQLWDSEKNVLLQGKENEEIMVNKPGSVTGEKIGSGIIIKIHERIDKKEASGAISKIHKVILFDKNIGREVVIFSDRPTYLEDSRAIVLIPDRSNNRPWEVKKVGDRIETEDAVFTVKNVDFEKEAVEVEKVSKEKGGKTQLMRLSKSGGNELLNK